MSIETTTGSAFASYVGAPPKPGAPRRRRLLSRRISFPWALVLPAILLPAWFAGSAWGWLPEQILPAPADVWTAGRDLAVSGELARHVAISLGRVAAGFAIGAVCGLILGAAMGLFPTVEDYARPLFVTIAQVPTLAWIPLLMLFLGIGEGLKLVVIAKAALIPITLNTLHGVRAVPREYIEVADSFGFSPWQRLRRVVLPCAVPPIFTGIRYGLTHAWIALVSVELLASSEGLGYLLVWGRQMFWLDTVLVSMIAIGIFGFLTDRILGEIETRLLHWRPQHV